MRCPKCGTDNPQGKIVCRACGARLRPAAGGGGAAASVHESDEELRRRVSYDLVRIVWVIGVVVAVGLGLGFLFK
jgi:uncharacterized membrane protein YvbJ